MTPSVYTREWRRLKIEKRMKVAGGFWPVTFFTLLLGAEPDILYIIVNDISFLSGFYKSKGDVRIWQER